MKCVVCGIDISFRPLYRTQPKGQDPKWTCEVCLKRPPDHEVKAIIDQIRALDEREIKAEGKIH